MTDRRRDPRRPSSIDPDTWTLAERVCTRNELAALEFDGYDLPQATIAVYLGISRRSVRNRIDNAARKIALAKETAA